MSYRTFPGGGVRTALANQIRRELREPLCRSPTGVPDLVAHHRLVMLPPAPLGLELRIASVKRDPHLHSRQHQTWHAPQCSRTMTAMHPNNGEALAGCRPNLLVNDVPASLRFYAEVLGFPGRGGGGRGRWAGFLDADEPGRPDTAQVGPGQGADHLHREARRAHNVAAPGRALRRPVNELHREWTGRRAVIAERRRLRAWGMYGCGCMIPDGNTLRVSSYPTDRWVAVSGVTAEPLPLTAERERSRASPEENYWFRRPRGGP